MGGKNEIKLCGLRFHLNETIGKVHIHDDSRNIKFLLNKDTFNKEVSEAFNLLNGKNGITKIEGDTSINFYILCEDKKYTVFISDKSSVKKELIDFTKAI